MPSKDAVYYTTNLRPEHHEQLLAEAARRGTTRNDVIRSLIETLPPPTSQSPLPDSSNS